MRRHHICVTGTIGSGKSYISKLFCYFGYALFDADKVVHDLFEKDKKVLAAISKLCPKAVQEGMIIRSALGKEVFEDLTKLQELEDILHPLVNLARQKFTSECEQKNLSCVFEIPLYFETGLRLAHTKIVVATAPLFLIKQRALKRPSMTAEKLEAILSRQMPDADKQKKADFVVHTGLSKGYSWQQVNKIALSMGKN